MAIEIEHKYLILEEEWRRQKPVKSVALRQGYLCNDEHKSLRVRLMEDRAFLTLKSRSKNARRHEFEYEIPAEDGKQMLELLAYARIEKTRHYITYEGKLWEVDEFEGLNKGLFVAEIELDREDETYLLPSWAGRNITSDKRYSNANLAINPFSTWDHVP